MAKFSFHNGGVASGDAPVPDLQFRKFALPTFHARRQRQSSAAAGQRKVTADFFKTPAVKQLHRAGNAIKVFCTTKRFADQLEDQAAGIPTENCPNF
jgi:hypothetical protein